MRISDWSSDVCSSDLMYLAAQRDSLEAPNVALDMRLPGYFSYTEVLEIELSKALAGDVSPQEALDAIAAEWNRLTDEFGRDVQLGAYRSSLGLPPLCGRGRGGPSDGGRGRPAGIEKPFPDRSDHERPALA